MFVPFIYCLVLPAVVKGANPLLSVVVEGAITVADMERQKNALSSLPGEKRLFFQSLPFGDTVVGSSYPLYELSLF